MQKLLPHNCLLSVVTGPANILTHCIMAVLTRQLQFLSSLANLVVRHTGVVCKIGRLHFADDKRVSTATGLHDTSLRRVQPHGIPIPQHLSLQTTLDHTQRCFQSVCLLPKKWQCQTRFTIRVRCSCKVRNFKLSSDCGDSSSKKCKRGCGGAYGRIW
jgi:hypothetical protein